MCVFLQGTLDVFQPIHVLSFKQKTQNGYGSKSILVQVFEPQPNHLRFLYAVVLTKPISAPCSLGLPAVQRVSIAVCPDGDARLGVHLGDRVLLSSWLNPKRIRQMNPKWSNMTWDHQKVVKQLAFGAAGASKIHTVQGSNAGDHVVLGHDGQGAVPQLLSPAV